MGLYDDPNEMQELLNVLIRVGYITTVNYANGTAQVHFPDDDDFVSHDLQVLHGNTLKNKDYIMPDIGELVLCLFLPYSVETGFILGSVYTNKAKTPESTGDKRTVVFEDGSRFSYDRKTHQFDAQIEGTTITATRQDVIVNTPNKVTITGNAEITVNTQTAKINAQTAIVDAKASYTLTTPEMTVNAAKIALNGDISVSGNVIAQGNVRGANLIYKGAVTKE